MDHERIDALRKDALSDLTNWGGLRRAMKHDLAELAEDRDVARADAAEALGASADAPAHPKPTRHDAAAFGASLATLGAMNAADAATGLVPPADLRATAETLDDPTDDTGRNGTFRNVGATPETPDRSAATDDAANPASADVPRDASREFTDPAGVESLTPRQRAAVAKLVCGRPLAAVAAELGVGRTTLYRWRNEPAFAREVARLGADAMDAASARARGLVLRATGVLAESLAGGDRLQWALKLVNSRRLWDMGVARLPTDAEVSPAA